MSAAAPLPPPGPPPGNTMNGYSNGPQPGGTGAFRGGDANPRAGSYPPMAEIVSTVEEKVNGLRQHSIRRILEEAKQIFSTAKAYTLVVEAIPSHREYIDKIAQSRSQMHRDYRQLSSEILSYEAQFKNIKEIISNDNKRNGAQHFSSRTSALPSSAASLYSDRSGSTSPASRTSLSQRDDELMLPDVPGSRPRSSHEKPQVHAKPLSLHGRALHQSSASLNGQTQSDDLADRFARLKSSATPLATVPASGGQDLSVKMPSPSDYQSSRPRGPRDMPHLNTDLATSMPREPSPTYSPARNLYLPDGGANPPRSSARSIVGTGGRSNSMQASSIAANPPHANGSTDSYFPPVSEGHAPPPALRKSSCGTTLAEEQISVERLYDYIQMYNVLIIDVRSREEFDSGHIFVRSIMCIEPTVLHDGCSAEQLQDRLVLSPDDEQAMFDRRDEYDLVVYYDQSTKNSIFLHKNNLTEEELALKRLYDTLHEFNTDKPLRRPPIFLRGGIDAWTDMLGRPGLKMSSTTTVVASKQTKPARAIQRVTAANHGGKLNLQKRRMREYVPMDPEEEQRWLEEARQGRAVFDEADDVDVEELETTSPLYHNTEDFLRRFPDLEAEQQSMIYPPRRPAPPPQYAPPSIPTAPSRPAPSVPRVSYSGVHERQPTAQGRASQLPAYVAPGRYGQIRLHKTGLLNFGVTCYMNSVVQCLCGNSDLVNIFLSRQYEKDLQKDNWRGTKGILSESFATLLSNLFKGDIGAVRPSTFRKACGRFNSQWGVDEQQDAKEFLEFVLDHLHEDLNVTWNKTPLKQLTEAEEQARERLPRPYCAKIEWNRYLHREQSMIGNLFAGQHSSRLTCMTCGTTSTTYEAFWSISVEIPHDRPADLRDCLRSYCSNERLSGSDHWRCPRCKCDREAMKKITITRAPDSLVVHFKRFSASHNERAHKIRTPINFPLRGLDLGPFMEPPITPEQEAYAMATARDAQAQLTGLKTDPAMNPPFVYNAYAVIWHLGNTLGSGHYVAHVKDKARGVWRQFNDDRIQDFDPGTLAPQNRLQNEKAYIVFYERERVAGGAL